MAVANQSAQYRWYMTSVACFVIPGGIQSVLFPWLILVQLQESAGRLGIAQTLSMLPGLVIILFAGLVADRVGSRRILIIVHILAAIPVIGLAVLLLLGYLYYPVLLIYAFVAGAIGTFSQPARDALLNQVAGNQIQRTVTISLGITFSAQVIGYGLASQADRYGPVLLLLIQAGMLLFGGWAAFKLNAGQERGSVGGKSWQQIKEGLLIVRQSTRMWPAFLLTTAQSIFFAGTFVVTLPLMVRTTYGGSSEDMALVFTAVMAGTIVTTFLLVKLGGIRNQGLALLLALGAGGLVIFSLYFQPPYVLFLFEIFIWGLLGGIVMAMSRTILQEAAPASHRARILSIFSLANMGGMPLGALMMGYSAEYWGVEGAVLLAMTGILVSVLCVGLFTQLRKVGPWAGPDAGQI